MTRVLAVACTALSCNSVMCTVGVALDTGGIWPDPYGRLNAVGGARSLNSGCSRDNCASDSVLRFSINVRVRSQSHRTSSSTKCSGRARRSGAASGWVASVAQGARGCGWSKHESGPALHALQLCSIEYVPPKPTYRERVATAYISIVSEMLGRLPR